VLRRTAGCLGLLGLVVGLAVLVALSGLPWWAVVYGCAFWVVLRLRWDRRGGEVEVAPAEDGPRWSSMRGGF
jgi:hypothetical protein